MFTLATDRSKYFRVKQGQSSGEIERILNTPAIGVFEGAIISISDEKLLSYRAKVGDTYRTVANLFGIDEERLKAINANAPVYPTCKLFVPCK